VQLFFDRVPTESPENKFFKPGLCHEMKTGFPDEFAESPASPLRSAGHNAMKSFRRVALVPISVRIHLAE
jgi:hypothetical protein